MMVTLLVYAIPVLSFVYVVAVYVKSRSVTSALVSGAVTSIVAGSGSGLVLTFMSPFVNTHDPTVLVTSVVLAACYIVIYLCAYKFRLAWIGKKVMEGLPETLTKPPARVRTGRVIAVIGSVLYFQFIILNFVVSVIPEAAFSQSTNPAIGFSMVFSMLAASYAGTILTVFGTLLSIDYGFLSKKPRGSSALWPDMGSDKI